ncbi:MAG: protein kinase [Pirellulales bacterium]|nr:protein kinase [Pirellulales bacterium]
MNLPPTQRGMPDGAQTSSAPFAHAGGTRPLDGYTIKRGIGHGGFGEVYYATSDAGKEVALKLIRRSLDVELRGIKQCLNLKHPNLLDIYDIRQDERGDHWVVMEFVSGSALDDVLASNPNGLGEEEALRWFHGIAAGVAYLHDHGIVHRDLKPGNIFSDEGRVQIGDYGLSKFVSCSRRSGHTESVGTVHYMAPEVANGRYGKEIDIYALGIVLFEMLTGRVPFEGESVGEVLMKHLTAKPDVSMLPEPYRSVVARALEKDPSMRFSSVAEMLARLPRPTGEGEIPRVGVYGASAQASAPNGNGAGQPPFAIVLPVSEPVDEEPIWAAVREFGCNLRDGWYELNITTRVILSVLAIIGAIMTGGIWMPLAFFTAVVYGVYRIIRSLVLAGQRRHVVAQPAPQQRNARAASPSPERPAATVRQAKLRRARRRPREMPAQALVRKPVLQRMADLIGSMLLGTVVVATVCLAMALVFGFHSELPGMEVCAWMVLVSLAGSWAVMIVGKFWEGKSGDPMLRRFVMLIVGLGLGVLAWGAADVLLVSLPYTRDLNAPYMKMPTSFYNNGPLLPAYVVAFGTLMPLVRWWHQTDPLRRVRLSLWTMLVTAIVAGVVAWAWQFPQPWLPMVACAMSASVQLASLWISPRKRLATLEDESMQTVA